MSANTYIPFDRPAIISAFVASEKRKTPDLLKRMSELVDEFINLKKSEWLIKALFEIISKDNEIKDDEVFTVSMTKSVRKADLPNVTAVCLVPFLIGVLSFILQKRPDNTLGRGTFELLYEQKTKSSAWKMKNDCALGNGFIKPIELIPFSRGCNSAHSGTPADEVDSLNTSNARDAIFEKLSGPLMQLAEESRRNLDGIAFSSSGPDSQTALLLGLDGKAPELTPDNFGNILLIDKAPLDDEPLPETFDNYLEKAVRFYSVVKTLPYSEKPRAFYDFYVCNHLQPKEYRAIYKKSSIIYNPTIADLSNLADYHIICGTGGIGKSMLLRHFFLDTAKTYEETGVLPILCPLKNYKRSFKTLLDFVYTTVSDFDRSISIDDVESMLLSGKCVILLDGLDEILSSLRNAFDEALPREAGARPAPQTHCRPHVIT